MGIAPSSFTQKEAARNPLRFRPRGESLARYFPVSEIVEELEVEVAVEVDRGTLIDWVKQWKDENQCQKQHPLRERSWVDEMENEMLKLPTENEWVCSGAGQGINQILSRPSGTHTGAWKWATRFPC